MEDEDAAGVQHGLMSFIRAFGLLAQEGTPCGQPMAPSDAHALTEIADNGRTQRALIDLLHLDPSSVSRLIDRLTRRGWVQRIDGPDRRTVQLVVTDQGRTIAAQLAASRRARFAALLDAVPADQRQTVVDAIALLVRAARPEGGSS